MSAKKILITYFSVFPAKDKFTEQFAKMIAEKTGGDLVEIECATNYPKLPQEYPLIEKIAYDELHANARPAIKNEIPVAEYDTVFVGYPIWCYTLPQVMFTFFDKYDLSGKTIIPFNTHEGSEDGGTWQTIRKLEPNATILPGLAIRDSEVEKHPIKKVEQWLSKIGF